jgi:hypothetical protein
MLYILAKDIKKTFRRNDIPVENSDLLSYSTPVRDQTTAIYDVSTHIQSLRDFKRL